MNLDCEQITQKHLVTCTEISIFQTNNVSTCEGIGGENELGTKAK